MLNSFAEVKGLQILHLMKGLWAVILPLGAVK